MTDADCVAFLRWALPALHLRWPGSRRARRQVCRRIGRRRAALGLRELSAYRRLLDSRELLPTMKERIMAIADLMSRNVGTCKADDRLDAAAKLMWDLDIGCVPVVDDRQHVIGIVTDRDICMATYTQGKAPQHVIVREAMAREVYSCLPDDSIAEAEDIMRKRRVRRLPVVDLDGRLVGLISLNDLARESARQQTRVQKDLTALDVSATLAAICQPRHAAVLPPAA